MRALALFAGLMTAKLLAVAGRDLSWSVWTPLARFWQDALVALVFGAVDYTLRKMPVAGRCVFWLIVSYAAVNVALTLILSSPLTWQMSRAAGGALADSIAHYLTWSNVVRMGVIVLAGALLPRLAVRTGLRARQTAVAGALALVMLGPIASARV